MTATPLYAKEFPGFQLDVSLPAGFVDRSWHNDVCPNFYCEAKRLAIWVDFAEATEREFPESPRFSVHRTDENGAHSVDELITDDWSEVLAFVEAHR